MSLKPSDELQQRILDSLDGILEAEEISRLDAELLESSEARKLYIQLAALHSALESQAASQSDVAKVPIIPIERLLAHQRRRVLRNSLLATAAVLLLSAVILWLKMVPDSTPLASFRVGPDSAFSLTHQSEGGAPSGNVLDEGSTLRLTRGSMEGEFKSGSRFVIEAPCEFTVLANDRIKLKEGVAWFKVTPQAVGFTVETHQLTVVDLGTTFGVLAKADAPHEVHVINGKVEAVSSGDGASSDKVQLGAGEARQVSSQAGLREIPFTPEAFSTSLPEVIRIANHSFEADRNSSPDGSFTLGNLIILDHGLSGWTPLGDRRPGRGAAVGWRDTISSEVDPHPPEKYQTSQVLSLMSGASVLNVTGTPWSALNEGDRLVLTVSLGLRRGLRELEWNENTFFGLTEGFLPTSKFPKPSDTVAHSGFISVNPATGDLSGDGSFTDVSLTHTVLAADLQRKGNIGILIACSSPKDEITNQSFFDNVRLLRKPGTSSQNLEE